MVVSEEMHGSEMGVKSKSSVKYLQKMCFRFSIFILKSKFKGHFLIQNKDAKFGFA